MLPRDAGPAEVVGRQLVADLVPYLGHLITLEVGVVGEAYTPKSLTDAAYELLKGRIVRCELAPGLRITEKQLVRETGFGVTPIREALARLDGDGLVQTMPRRGYQVAPLTIKAVDELFQVWRILGPAIAELAARTTEPEQWRQMRLANLARLREVGGQPARAAATIDASRERYVAMARATGNGRLLKLFLQLSDELARVFTMVFLDPDATGRLLAEAGEDAPEGQVEDEAAAARARAERWIDSAHEQVLTILRSWPAGEPDRGPATLVPPLSDTR